MLVPNTALLTAATATGPGPWFNGTGRVPSFDAEVAGTGAVTATVVIECRNTPGGAAKIYGTFTLSGTTLASEVGNGGSAQAPVFTQYRANVTARTGTGAAVTVGGML
jgi:hypothetical protein